MLGLVMFVLAIGEEVGWTGYLLEPLQARFGPLGASLIIALPWWLGHIPSILEIGGAWTDIAWWLPGSVALRILMTGLFNGAGGSVCAVVLFHMMLNVGRSVAYPVVGNHYDPLYQATGYGIAGLFAILVVIAWCAQRPRRLDP